jgi:hypothetical protein
VAAATRPPIVTGGVAFWSAAAALSGGNDHNAQYRPVFPVIITVLNIEFIYQSIIIHFHIAFGLFVCFGINKILMHKCWNGALSGVLRPIVARLN